MHRSQFIPFAAVLLSGCHDVKAPVSKIEIVDIRTANQLLSGFYQPENGKWCWTAREFSIALKPPDGGEQRGATLEMEIYVPDVQIGLLGPMTLSANAGSYTLAPETFSKSGTHIYSRNIPGDVLATSLLPVRFSFDKARSPLSGDGRELGAIVSKIELQAN
jgi:hypothetical protein